MLENRELVMKEGSRRSGGVYQWACDVPHYINTILAQNFKSEEVWMADPEPF